MSLEMDLERFALEKAVLALPFLAMPCWEACGCNAVWLALACWGVRLGYVLLALHLTYTFRHMPRTGEIPLLSGMST